VRSLVAGVNALFRSRESRVPAPARLLDDPYARLFGERHPLVFTLRALRWLLPPLRRLVDELQTAHCVRHRSIDELCLRAVGGEGFRQVVVLGAGYDTRALRLGERLPPARWIEVDHPATAARKARLSLRSRLPDAVGRVSLDLERDELAPALERAGFDPAAPTCFVLEGLAHYLPRPTFARLLAATARGPGPRRVIVSYIRRDMARTAPPLFVALVNLLREVPTTYFDRDELARLAQHSGLRLRDCFTFADQVARLLPTPPARAPRLSQDIATFDAGDPPTSRRFERGTLGGFHTSRDETPAGDPPTSRRV
jgi:methyltransferase (TIGR00027 family)